jgi:hypothetical protein
VTTRSAFALLAAAALLLAATASADYGPTISGGTSSNSERKLAVAPNGTIYATYTEPVGNTTGVFVKRSSDGGANWAVLPRLGAAEAFRSCLVVDDGGVLHIAWTEFVGPDRQVFYARWDGGPNWTGLERLSDTPGYSGFPSMAQGPAGTLQIVWYGFDGATYQVYYRYKDARGWQPTVQATHGVKDANNPSLAVDGAGRAHVAFYSYFRGEFDVWYIGGGPNMTWGTPEHVNTAGVPAADPSIEVVNGTPAIAYASGANTTLEVRYVERSAAGDWPASFAVSRTGEGGNHPSLVTDGAGNVAVLFENASGAIRLRSRVAGAWADPVTVPSSGDARWVSATFVAGAAGGRVAAIWTEGEAGAYRTNFAQLELFPAPPCTCGPDPLEGLVIPVVVLLVAGASCVGLALAVARTKGGGRG